MKEHGRFSIAGSVTRKWANDKGTFARLGLSVSDGQRKRNVDVKAFAARVVASIARLSDGDMVTVAGDVQSEKLTDKTKQEVQVDGRPVWMPSLVATEIKLEAQQQQQPPPPDDDFPGF